MLRGLLLVFVGFSTFAMAESFTILRGIELAVSLPKSSFSKYMFITDRENQLISVNCNLPVHWNFFDKTSALVVNVSESPSRMRIGGVSHPNEHHLVSQSIESFASCQAIVDSLMGATSDHPITLSIEDGGGVSLSR